RRLEEHGDVALAVEPAAVANVAVVDQDRVDVGGLRPADALQRDRDIAARLNDLGLDQRHAGGDHVYDGRLDVPRDGPDRVSAAQVVGCVEGEGEVAVRVGVYRGEFAIRLFPAGSADAVAGHRAPSESH